MDTFDFGSAKAEGWVRRQSDALALVHGITYLPASAVAVPPADSVAVTDTEGGLDPLVMLSEDIGRDLLLSRRSAACDNWCVSM
jgi:hypothetical protein